MRGRFWSDTRSHLHAFARTPVPTGKRPRGTRREGPRRAGSKAGRTHATDEKISIQYSWEMERASPMVVQLVELVM